MGWNNMFLGGDWLAAINAAEAAKYAGTDATHTGGYTDPSTHVLQPRAQLPVTPQGLTRVQPVSKGMNYLESLQAQGIDPSAIGESTLMAQALRGSDSSGG